MTRTLYSPRGESYELPSNIAEISQQLEWVLDGTLDLSQGPLTQVPEAAFSIFAYFLQNGELPQLHWDELLSLLPLEAYFDIEALTYELASQATNLYELDPETGRFYDAQLTPLFNQIRSYRMDESAQEEYQAGVIEAREEASNRVTELEQEFARTNRGDRRRRDELRELLVEARRYLVEAELA